MDGAQGGLEIVQAKTFVPIGKPVIEVVGDNEFVIVPPPETKVHTPVPTVGTFEFINAFGLLMHNVWLEPAFARVGA